MTASVRIPMRLAKWLADNVEQSWPGSGAQQAVRELREAMKPKRHVVAHRKERAKKTRTKAQETAVIRALVFERAEGICELCETAGADELHHAFGRVRARQSHRNCIASCRDCHRHLTRNHPSAAYWLERQIKHFKAHGFSDEAGLMTRLLAKAEYKTKSSAALSARRADHG